MSSNFGVWAFALFCGILMICDSGVQADDSDSDMEEFYKSIHAGLTKSEDLLDATIKNIKELFQKVDTDAEGDYLLYDLRRLSTETGLPVYASEDFTCDEISSDFWQIKDCLGCKGGEWKVYVDPKYADCKTNGSSIKAANLALLLLPLLLLKVFM